METDVAKRLHEVLECLPSGVRLVAISKYHPNEYIEAAYSEGQRSFGESHEQELARKVDTLPKDIEWHFIGHLQTNKVKYIAPYISMIEAVDSLKLLKEIKYFSFCHFLLLIPNVKSISYRDNIYNFICIEIQLFYLFLEYIVLYHICRYYFYFQFFSANARLHEAPLSF